MNYRDFYKSNKSPWKKYLHLLPEGVDPKEFEAGFKDEYEEHPQVGPEGAAKIAVQHLQKNPRHYTLSKKAGLEEKELLKGMNLEDCACDDGLPKRDDGALDIEHDGRPIHLSKIIQVGAEFGQGPATGELSGYYNVGVNDKSSGKDLSKDGEGIHVAGDNDKEPITAGGKAVESDLASSSVGGKVVSGGGQKQGGPNTVGSIAGTPKGSGEGEAEGTLTLQEAKSKLRGMVKEALKEIKFDKKSGKWVRITENTVDMKMGPSYKKVQPRMYQTSEDDWARRNEYDPEITEMYDQEEENLAKSRYNELVNAQRNLSESEMNEMKSVREKIERMDIAKRNYGLSVGGISPNVYENEVNMKMGPSWKKQNPQYRTAEQDPARTVEYDPEITEAGPGVAEPEVEPEVDPGYAPGVDPDRAPVEPGQPDTPDPLQPDKPGIAPRPKGRMAEKAPAGWEGTVKAMKKEKGIDNPWALAHWMKNKGMTSHKEEQEEGKEDYKGKEDFLAGIHKDLQAQGVERVPEPEMTPDEEEELERERQANLPYKGYRGANQRRANLSKLASKAPLAEKGSGGGWINKSWDELTPEQKSSAEDKYSADTKDDPKYARTADWYVNSRTGEVSASNPDTGFKATPRVNKMAEAGGQAEQWSSARTVKDMPQIPKNRHRGDID